MLRVYHPATVGLSICVILNWSEVILIGGCVAHLDIQRGGAWVSTQVFKFRKEPDVLEDSQTGDLLLREPTIELVLFLILEHVSLLFSQDVAVD